MIPVSALCPFHSDMKNAAAKVAFFLETVPRQRGCFVLMRAGFSVGFSFLTSLYRGYIMI